VSGWQGLGVSNIRWMFTQQQDYYRPLAWLSHGVDYALFGLEPWGHHLTSILIHCASTVLFFVLCRRLLASQRAEQLQPFAPSRPFPYGDRLGRYHGNRPSNVRRKQSVRHCSATEKIDLTLPPRNRIDDHHRR